MHIGPQIWGEPSSGLEGGWGLSGVLAEVYGMEAVIAVWVVEWFIAPDVQRGAGAT